MYLEGRGWMQNVFDNFNAKPVGKMTIGKYYLYQMYTTVFVEFDSIDELTKCRKWLDEHEKYWDYDTVATLDTNDYKVIKRWKEFIN